MTNHGARDMVWFADVCVLPKGQVDWEGKHMPSPWSSGQAVSSGQVADGVGEDMASLLAANQQIKGVRGRRVWHTYTLMGVSTQPWCVV